jgi:hypothetical protein
MAPSNEDVRVIRNAAIDIVTEAALHPIKNGKAAAAGVASGVQSILRDINNGQPVDLQKATTEAATAMVSERIVGRALYKSGRPWTEVPGAKPQKLWSQLTGKHAVHSVLKEVAQQLLKWELRSAWNALMSIWNPTNADASVGPNVNGPPSLVK